MRNYKTKHNRAWLRAFIGETCRTGGRVTHAALWHAFQQWAPTSGYPSLPLSSSAFARCFKNNVDATAVRRSIYHGHARYYGLELAAVAVVVEEEEESIVF